ncbi:hypermethylated in cancer 2 protein-like [Nerophis ophidion]|uniref:hypermethylated in cancer 2 protein-like n=1 Tax=Nerophis ophidion TaxID=159077 RepID=UPI002ADFCFEB|nr:hypermethylated in cancer 2 protein-like [Nerophis ophidion]
MEAINSHATLLLACLNHQRQQARWCDCVLRQRQDPGQLYPAHKCVLAASSPVLAAMLSFTGSLVELQAPCMADSVLALVLDYIYTGALPCTLSWRQSEGLLAAAHFLKMEDLQEFLMNSPQVDGGKRTLDDPFGTPGIHEDGLMYTSFRMDEGPQILNSRSRKEEELVKMRRETVTNSTSSFSVIRHISRGASSPGRRSELHPACEAEGHDHHHCLTPHGDVPIPPDLDLHVSSCQSEQSSDDEDVGSKVKMLCVGDEEEDALIRNGKCPVLDIRAPSVSGDHVQASSTLSAGGPPFHCSLCTRSFSQRGSLNRHVRAHLGVRPFPCPRCSMTFSCQYRVTEHMHVHKRCRNVGNDSRTPPVSSI